MKRIIASFIAAVAIGMPVATAQDNASPGELASWATSMPGSINGVKIFTMAEENGAIRMSDLVDFAGTDKDGIFVNVMADIRRNLTPEIEEIENLDIEGRRVLLRRSVPDQENAATYNYSVALQTADEMLSFLIYDISIGYREKGILPRTLEIEKMRPADNRRHKELVEAFALSASEYVRRLAGAVASSEADAVTHWPEIISGKVVKGMNPTEVILVNGRPTSERVMGKRTKWMYGNDNVVVFTDGVVTTVI